MEAIHILSIDWDFFVSLFGPSQLVVTAPRRAPACWFELDHSYRLFWKRVHVIPGAPLVWDIHHATLSGLRRSGMEPFASATHVVSFDAYHDGGYFDEPTGLYDHDWTAAYPSVEVILPQWRPLTGEEYPPLVSLLQTNDDGYREFPGPFAGVFICCSHEGTPKESHDAFQEFLALAPEPVQTAQPELRDHVSGSKNSAYSPTP
ncbi:MAG TPA: hypothetical protein VFU08_03555 [Candidatus Udaeobacter sp.]|nr:hypothetical protein [Candidatus Udaeobacter sp.]